MTFPLLCVLFIEICCFPQTPFVKAAGGISSEEPDSYLGIRLSKYNN